jgi:inner membrane transporter RhtA
VARDAAFLAIDRDLRPVARHDESRVLHVAADDPARGIAVALEFTGPLAVAAFSSRRASHFVWLGLAVVGMLFLLPLNLTASHIDPVGAGFALAAGACWAVYIVFGQKAGVAHGATASAWGMLIGSCVAVPIGVASAGMKLLDLAILPFGLAVAVLSSSLPYTLEMFGSATCPRACSGR